MTVKVTGLQQAESQLNGVLRELRDGSEEMALQIMQGISDRTAPYVPVDTSFLLNSETRRLTRNADKLRASIGFVAAYAEDVHDGPQRRWQKPGASNRYLELGLRDFLADDLSSIIARFVE